MPNKFGEIGDIQEEKDNKMPILLDFIKEAGNSRV